MRLGWDAKPFTERVSETGTMESEIAELISHGYTTAYQTGVGSHVNVRRTVTVAVPTGGLSLVFCASRSGVKTTITFCPE